MNEEKGIKILLVEDNIGDVELFTEALSRVELPYTLNIMRDGVEALDYLFCRDKYQQAERPDLVMLDINLPKKDGREVLKAIKSEKNLLSIPVVMMSSSKSMLDVDEAYAAHANCFVLKQPNLKSLVKSIQTLILFWSDMVILPSKK